MPKTSRRKQISKKKNWRKRSYGPLPPKPKEHAGETSGLQEKESTGFHDDACEIEPNTSISIPKDQPESQQQNHSITDIHHQSSTEGPGTIPLYESVQDHSVSQELMLEAKHKLDLFLPRRWLAIVDKNVFHVIHYSAQYNLSIQRSLDVDVTGSAKLFVHCQPIEIDPYINNVVPATPLSVDAVNVFVDRLVCIVNKVRCMEVSSGFDEASFESAWSSCPLGEIDRNPYKECRFLETFRSFSCQRLVPFRKWRCAECQKLYGPLRRRAAAVSEEKRHSNTPNIHLTDSQKLEKLKEKQNELYNAKRRLTSLRHRMQQVIEKMGVQIDNLMSNDFAELLRNSDMSPAQSIFMQQQIKASQQKNASGMRWHPTMIRLALSIHLTSPAAYELMRQTGMVKLPSSRTLFDYSHSRPADEGIDKTVLESLSNRVSKFKEDHKKFHVLMPDEMHISQNLVFQKGSGLLVGYTSLDDVDSEVKGLLKFLEKPDEEIGNTVATKVLVYMVKGVTNGIKEVVPTFGVGNLSANQMYKWTWQVIRALESSGVAVVAVVCDGSSVNRTFIKKHTPATVDSKHGVIYDTWNKAAPSRRIFFMSDVPHLLKTLRNCLLNSRWDGKRSRRKMTKNGKKISWDFVIKLYELKKQKVLRKSYKLNAMNVYPDSYARMKVKYAGQVVSDTVSKDMASQGWDDAEETILFLKKFNDWFDRLNGAHSFVAKKTGNKNLAAYTSINDERFDQLDDLLDYLDEWEENAKSCNYSMNVTVGAEASRNVNDCNDSDIEDRAELQDETPTSKRLLSSQTLHGIRMSTLAFKPLVRFMLEQKAKYINARVFTQDPLEQHFSKVRAGQGGSSNPNLGQVLKRNRALYTIGQLGMKKRKGNSGEDCATVEVTTEPLPKRKCNRVPKLLQDCSDENVFGAL